MEQNDGPMKRIASVPCRFGGEPHSGWLPPGAAIPLPTPINDVLLDLEIEYDGFGYLLSYSSSDGTVFGDTWHPSMADAEQVAQQLFGIQSSQWQRV